MASAQPGGGASAAGSDAAGADTGPEAVADLIADELDRLGGPARQRLAEVLHQLGAIDRAVYAAVAAVPAPALDTAMRRLSNSANHSRLWLAIAGALALTGPAGRRSASRGALAIGITSALVALGRRLRVRHSDQQGQPLAGHRDQVPGRERRLLQGPHWRPLPRRYHRRGAHRRRRRPGRQQPLRPRREWWWRCRTSRADGPDPG